MAPPLILVGHDMPWYRPGLRPVAYISNTGASVELGFSAQKGNLELAGRRARTKIIDRIVEASGLF
jgi:hypothetical protein